MKKLTVFFIAICTGILFLQCDKIEEPFKEPSGQKVSADTPYFEVRTDFIQKYLLEDFTGHTCLNCPKAHTIMKEMQDAMKDANIRTIGKKVIPGLKQRGMTDAQIEDLLTENPRALFS